MARPRHHPMRMDPLCEDSAGGSALAFDSGGSPTAPPAESHRPMRLVLALAIVPMVAVTMALGATSDHLQRPLAAAVYWSYLIAASMGAGLYWWWRRPVSRFGPLLVAFGGLVWLVSWQGGRSPGGLCIGVVAAGAVFFLSLFPFLGVP